MPDPNLFLPGPMERGLVNPARAGRQQRCLFRVCRGYPGISLFHRGGGLRNLFRQVTVPLGQKLGLFVDHRSASLDFELNNDRGMLSVSS